MNEQAALTYEDLVEITNDFISNSMKKEEDPENLELTLKSFDILIYNTTENEKKVNELIVTLEVYNPKEYSAETLIHYYMPSSFNWMMDDSEEKRDFIYGRDLEKGTHKILKSINNPTIMTVF